MRKIVITVAPVAGKHLEGTVNPLSPETIARDVIACAKAGASQVHLHVRDVEGNLTEDISVFSDTMLQIRKQSDIILQGSTGGVSDLTLEARCTAVKEPRVEVVSLNLGSCNFGEGVYVNTLPDIRYWAGKISAAGVKPELEIFDAGMMNNVALLAEEGVLKAPFAYGFVLGVRGALPATAHSLHFLQGLVPPGSIWGCIHAEMEDLSLLATAIGMGASFVRVGFEDSIYYSPGKIAGNNAELVDQVADLIHSMGLEAANPEEARRILEVFPKR